LADKAAKAGVKLTQKFRNSVDRDLGNAEATAKFNKKLSLAQDKEPEKQA